MELFTDLFTRLNELLDTFFNQGVENAVQFVSGPLTIFATISIILVGILFLRGMIEMPLNRLIQTLFIVGFVFAIAGSAANYNQLLGEHLRGLPDDLMLAFATGPETIPDAETAADTLDQIGENIFDGARNLWQASGLRNPGPALLALFVGFIFIIFSVAASFALILALVGVTITAAVGPIFILGLLFASTREFFTRWLNYSLNFAFLAMFVGLVLGLSNSIILDYVERYSQTVESIDFVQVFSPLVLLSIVASIFTQLPNFASSLAGGISVPIGNKIADLTKAGLAPARAFANRTYGEHRAASQHARMRQKTMLEQKRLYQRREARREGNEFMRSAAKTTASGLGRGAAKVAKVGGEIAQKSDLALGLATAKGLIATAEAGGKVLSWSQKQAIKMREISLANIRSRRHEPGSKTDSNVIKMPNLPQRK